MLREVLKFTDFDNQPKERVLWFNLTKTELMTNFVLMDRIEKFRNISQEDARDLTPAEKEDLVDLVTGIMKLSYGERQGDLHVKSEEAWNRFRWSPAYDDFLYSLFVDEPRAMLWISTIMPPELQAQVAAERAKMAGNASSDASSGQQVFEPGPPAPQTPSEAVPPTPTAPAMLSIDLPSWVTENRQPTAQEWADATPEQIQEAMRRKVQ